MKEKFKEYLQAIGVLVFCVALFSIPILATCSFCLGWNLVAKYLLTMGSIVELTIAVAWIQLELMF